MHSLVTDLRICCEHIRNHRQRQITFETKVIDADRRGRSVEADDLLTINEARSAIALLTQAARSMAAQSIDLRQAKRTYPDLAAALGKFDAYWSLHTAEAASLGQRQTVTFEAYRAELRNHAARVPPVVVAGLFVTLTNTLHQFPVAVASHVENDAPRLGHTARRRDHLVLVHSR